ncbi:MAG TPA: glycosyltransferase family 4 protein [Coriobacteriia bacterium]
MRILILYPFLAKAGSLGGVARVTRLVEYLDRREHDVWLACFATERELGAHEDDGQVKRHCREMVVLPIPARSLAHKAASLMFDPHPAYVDHYRSSAMRREVARILATEAIDVFHIEFTYLGDYVTEAENAGCATVLVDEELNFRAYQRLHLSAPRSARGVRALWESARFKRHELAVVTRFDKVLAIADGEREILLEHLPDLDVGIYPNTVDTEHFEPRAVEPDPRTIVFVGNFEHYPNADGVSWFVREVLPRVRESVPEAHLDLIGANVTPAVRALDDGTTVRVLGYVDDIRPHLAAATLFACPLVNGGGMRGKALEAMSMQRPVVSTPIGIEGIAARDGHEALVARSPREFADAVVRLLGDAGLRQRLGQAGRALVRERYDDRVVFAELERTYAALADRARARRASGSDLAAASAASEAMST